MAYYKPEELENVRKGLEWAKKNPADPKSIEIQNRLKSGQLNFELKALGLKEVPIQRPKITMPEMPQAGDMSSPSSVKPTLGQTAKEMGGDVMDTARNLGTTISEGAQSIQDLAGNKDLNLAQKSMGILGSLMGTGAKTIGDVATGAGKLALTQDAEDQLKAFVEEKAQGVAETETAKKVVDWYANLTPENKLIVDSAGGFASLVAEVVGGETASSISKPLKEGVETALETGANLTKQGARTVGETVDAFQASSRPRRIAAQEVKVDEAVARIIQGTPDDIAQAKKALMEIDTEGVTTYTDLNTRMQDTVDTLRTKVDAELEKNPNVYTKFQLARKNEVKIGDKTKTVYDNPTISALDELDGYYTAIKDIAKLEKVKAYKASLESEGLKLKDVNEIARMHGKDLNAFNANGELASGLTKQAAENTRKGLKETVRQNMPDDKTRALDESMSNILNTMKLTTDMETKVQRLYQKVKNRTLPQKVGGAIADVVDLLSLGSLRGFVQKLLPSNVGLKTANSMDLEKELSKNLAEIDKLLEIKDEKKFAEAFTKYVEEVQPGLSTRVKSGLTEGEKDALLGKLQNVQSNDVVKKTSLLGEEVNLELFDRLEQLKLKSEKAGGLSEREYAELNVLMDEVEQGVKQSLAPVE